MVRVVDLELEEVGVGEGRGRDIVVVHPDRAAPRAAAVHDERDGLDDGRGVLARQVVDGRGEAVLGLAGRGRVRHEGGAVCGHRAGERAVDREAGVQTTAVTTGSRTW